MYVDIIMHLALKLEEAERLFRGTPGPILEPNPV